MEYDLRKRAEIVLLAQEVAKTLKADPLIDYFDSGWISVEDKPLADITIYSNGTSITTTYENYRHESGVDMLFAVPLSNGEYSICRGFINDNGDIYQNIGNDMEDWWGYSLEDVTHYMIISNPKERD